MSGRSMIKSLSALILVVLCFLGTAGCTLVDADEPEGGNGTMQILSSAFNEDGMIPKRYTCEGEDVSPALAWSGIPEGTAALVLICDDPDAPVGTWVHWVLYGLSPDTTELPEGVPVDEEVFGAKQGRNDFGNIGYGGPCPPPGPAHRYFFKLYAIDTELTLAGGASKTDVMSAIEGHILGEAQVMGRYGR